MPDCDSRRSEQTCPGQRERRNVYPGAHPDGLASAERFRDLAKLEHEHFQNQTRWPNQPWHDIRLGGGRVKNRFQVEEVDPPRALAWAGKTLGIRAVHTWRLNAMQDGTHVATEESFEGFIVRLFPGLMNKMLAKALEQGLAALKSEAESRHARRDADQHVEARD